MFFNFFSLVFKLSDELALVENIQESISVHEMFPGNMKLEMYKMLGSLVLLLTIFGVGVWAFKKFVKSRGHGFGGSSQIKILERRSLTPKTSIYLIRVVNKTFVIAETAEKITLLAEFPPDTDINHLLQENHKHVSSCPTSDFLSKAIQKIQKKQQTKQD
ncbi:flagellar biosynthetic protein FliO,Flagellar biosynthesis protein, FliO [Chlamydia serpentis]|uniref:Flagellar biosynthetic protein FliO,Flagellar biosynthesis protein, FliO n=1 Tax=Chlamydia serpentis TaxID=1967782 RepID=A0A2R8FB45_9CHLA|nr:FliO/MopB family protein [Chlamydia serpentis]SPN73542.1 flagellar biosynthetic protein FliO,Flagellar biosynthesis protein, FliO [Chlamydia serpentis]